MKTFLILLTFVFQLNNANEFILNTLKKCDLQTKRTQADVNRCFKNVADAARQKNRAGEQRWGLVRLEPMNIADFLFKQKEGSVNLEATFSEILLRGVSNYTITDIDARYEHRNATISVFVPSLTAEGKYIMQGNLFLVQVNGTGDFWIQIDEIEITINGKLVANKENPAFLGIQDTTAMIKVKKISTQLMNLFPDDPILDETVHHFINVNYQLILDQLMPELSTRISKGLEVAIDNTFINIPVEAIYPNGI